MPHAGWLRIVGSVLNWPWLVILFVGAVWRWHQLLPPLPHRYALEGIAGAVTIAGIGAPLLNMMRPEEAWEAFWDTRVMRRGIFRFYQWDERFLENPAVRKAMAEEIRANNATAQQVRFNVATNSRRALLLSIVAIVLLPWMPVRNHAVTWLTLGIPLGFAARSLTEQWLVTCVREVARYADWLFALAHTRR